MTNSDIPKINIDDIMQRIKKEVEEEKKASPKNRAQEALQIVSRLSLPKSDQGSPGLDSFLWRYGVKHAKTINKIPLLRTIAKKQYWRLVSMKQHQSSPVTSPQTSVTDLDFLRRNWYYYDFLEQTKREGLKGRIKRFLFRSFGFHAWWQGQINRMIYQELIRHKAELAEKDNEIKNVRDASMERIKISEENYTKTIVELREEMSGMVKQIRELKQG